MPFQRFFFRSRIRPDEVSPNGGTFRKERNVPPFDASTDVATVDSFVPVDGAVPERQILDERLAEDESSVDEGPPPFVSADGKIDWGAALRANEGWIRSTIAMRVGEAAAVEEVFQEVALAATRQKAPIQDPRKIGSWLYRLAMTHSLLYRRSIGRKKKLLKRYEETLPPVESDERQTDPLQWLLLEERRACVRRATALLPDDEREILALKYVDDKSYKEIAEKTGLTVSAVQSKLYRARARLKEKLTQGVPKPEGALR